MNLKWIPESLHEENGPAPMGRPEDWLDAELVEDVTHLIDVAPGETVTFSTFEDFGCFTISVGKNGLAGPPLRDADTPDMFTGQTQREAGMKNGAIPPEANLFWQCGEEGAGETLSDVAAQIAEMENFKDDETEDFVIGACRWTMNVPMRLSEDGKRFERVEQE